MLLQLHELAVRRPPVPREELARASENPSRKTVGAADFSAVGRVTWRSLAPPAQPFCRAGRNSTVPESVCDRVTGRLELQMSVGLQGFCFLSRQDCRDSAGRGVLPFLGGPKAEHNRMPLRG